MTIQVRCRNCRARLDAGDELAGRCVQCPNCHSTLSIPDAAASVVPPPLPTGNGSGRSWAPVDAFAQRLQLTIQHVAQNRLQSVTGTTLLNKPLLILAGGVVAGALLWLIVIGYFLVVTLTQPHIQRREIKNSVGDVLYRKHVYEDADQNWVMHGLEIQWHPNGQKAEEKEYAHGKLHGTHTTWDEDGQQRSMQEYRRGVPHGRFIAWDPTGHKSEEGFFKNGKKDGIWIEWRGISDEQSLDGENHKFLQREYRQGKPEGRFTVWYRNDQMWQEGFYKNGKQHGSWKEWDSDGQLTKQETYRDGRLIASLETK